VDTYDQDYEGYIESMPGATGASSACCRRKTRRAIT